MSNELTLHTKSEAERFFRDNPGKYAVVLNGIGEHIRTNKLADADAHFALGGESVSDLAAEPELPVEEEETEERR